jgi:outer membrane receptor for Fe3+-dicitrate
MIEQRNARSPRILSIRPMTSADIESLRQPSARHVIAKIRDSHHTVARLFASGMRNHEVAAAVGYSQTRISLLRSSPAMVELVERYRADETTAWKETRDEYYSTIHAAGAKAWRQINDQLDAADEADEPLPLQRLLAIADSSADRVGYNKKSTTVNINVDFASRLEQAIARSAKVKLIDNQLED